jgi:hypothetical protein
VWSLLHLEEATRVTYSPSKAVVLMALQNEMLPNKTQGEPHTIAAHSSVHSLLTLPPVACPATHHPAHAFDREHETNNIVCTRHTYADNGISTASAGDPSRRRCVITTWRWRSWRESGGGRSSIKRLCGSKCSWCPRRRPSGTWRMGECSTSSRCGTGSNSSSTTHHTKTSSNTGSSSNSSTNSRVRHLPPSHDGSGAST